jgi:hypothetical protein
MLPSVRRADILFKPRASRHLLTPFLDTQMEVASPLAQAGTRITILPRLLSFRSKKASRLSVLRSSESQKSSTLYEILTGQSYRLGVTGFMTSAELRKAGYKANNGFHDQRVALQWIKKNIGGFGGNSDEITTVGESAGGRMYTFVPPRLGLTVHSVCHHASSFQGASHETLSEYRRRRALVQTYT